MIHDYMTTIKEYNTERRLKKEELLKWEKKKKKCFQELEDLEEVLVVFQTAASVTQNKLATDVSKIVTKAIKAVFVDDNYSFKVKFEKRRNTTECDLLLIEDGKEMKPLDDCGYGVADIISIGLRVAFWKLDGKCRNFFLLDEPTRNLDAKKQPFAAEMIKRLSQMGKGIQFLIVTHQEPLAEKGDRIFRTVKGKKTSQLKRIK